jgi:hypothetical protein
MWLEWPLECWGHRDQVGREGVDIEEGAEARGHIDT